LLKLGHFISNRLCTLTVKLQIWQDKANWLPKYERTLKEQ